MEWTHEQRIDAPADVVWRLTADVADWPVFMPTMRSVELLDGDLRLGARARIKQPGQPRAVWQVTAFEPGRAFSWESRRRGMTLVGRHRVTPDGDGAVSSLAIELTGRLAPVLGPLMTPVLRWVLRTENACFAGRAAEVTGAVG